jgi:hypothetical protein
MKKIFLCFVFLFLNQAHAATIGSAYIFGERLDGNLCGLSNSATEAAIATALRQNRIAVSQDRLSRIKFYYQINSLELGSTCVVNINFQVFTYGDYLVPSSPPKNLFSKIELCGNSYLLTGPKYDLQSRVSDTSRTLAEMCINDVSKQ